MFAALIGILADLWHWLTHRQDDDATALATSAQKEKDIADDAEIANFRAGQAQNVADSVGRMPERSVTDSLSKWDRPPGT